MTIGPVDLRGARASVAVPQHESPKASMRHLHISRLWIRAAMGIAISGLFAAATISRIDLELLPKAWAAVGLGLLAVATLVSFVEVAVRAVRWRILLRPLASVGFATVLGYLSIGHLANAILPARLGDVARAVLTGVRLRTSRTSVLGTIAVERVSDAGLLGLAVLTGMLIGFRQLAPVVVAFGIAGTAALIVALVAFVVLGHHSIAATRAGEFLRRHGGRFLAGAAALRSPRRVLAVGALTAASFGLTVIMFSTVASAVGLTMPLWQSALVIAAVTLSTAIPAGPASIGTYEFVGMTVMTSMGFPAEQSVLTVALAHLAVVLPPSAMGLVAMWWLGIRPQASRIVPAAHARSTPETVR